MTDLYIVRHGQTVWNKMKRIQGRQNSPLTEEGIHQSLVLSEYFSDIPFTRCFCSPMPRAIHTAHLLIGQRGTPLSVEPLLAEMNLGKWEGFTATDFQNKDPGNYEAFFRYADSFVPDNNGESFEEVVNRAKAFLFHFENISAENGPFLCVTHCILLQALTMICEDRPLSTLRSAHRVQQTSPFLFRYDREKRTWAVLRKNST